MQTQLDTVADTPLTGEGNTKPPPITRARCWFMTWNSYPEGWAGTLTQHTLDWVGQLEEGESGNRHVQACFRFTNPRTFDQVKALFPGAHIEVCRDWRAATAYCKKKETRVVTDSRPNYFRMMHCVLTKWQAEIIDIISGEPDMRAIHWYWSNKGGYGKTTFARHLIIQYNAYLVQGCGRDAFYAIKEATPSIVIFDVARSDKVEYKVLECVKNGLFFAGKYESAMYCGIIPHVIVLANYPPVESELSADRWHIVEL